uniref:DUF4232 domain-containing protein n=1 Tax=Thermomicrobium roseum TaxID=500 RepID=A0A7C1G2K0_THERO
MVFKSAGKARLSLLGLLITAGVLIMVACVSSVNRQLVTTTSVRTVTPSESASTVSPSGASCRSADVTLIAADGIAEPTGQHSVVLALTNVSGRPCSLFGYPTIRLLNAHAMELPFRYRQGGDQVVTSQPPQSVTLAPGNAAYVTLNKYRCDLGDREMAVTIALVLPGDPRTLMTTVPPSLDLGYCGPGDPGSTVTVSPFGASLKDTLAR